MSMPSEDFGNFVPGGTKYHNNAWLKLTHDPFVIKNINGVRVDLEKHPHQMAVPREFQMSKENRGLLIAILKQHLDRGIVELCTPSRGEFILNVLGLSPMETQADP